ncbi:hypothetical protein PSECIP111951_01980 [Pseudoalteromonas holothuriae]|uniref:Membrane protein triplicated sequence n=1 Tax=Pseudoalteromonas holothuriae TaxID=2963714 RepID=A0A9W4VPR1_9GAMM|nr:hypothetical protein PSECIP111854_01363 [Pseudoalteromonas sp. CIP111854]CAH9058976.1 hypothetical protein PSECIP111951_01980 [Pseudoalteromonas sp. CIP111951]
MFGELSLHFETIVVLGFILAFIFNLSFFLLKLSQNSSLLFSSGVMAISYFLSNHFFDLILGTSFQYLIWLAFDLVTISFIWLLHKVLKLRFSTASTYVFLGLSINSILFLLMHIDISLLANRQHWWFWTTYSILVNVFDFLMVVALIINRDFLFIVKGGRKITKHFSRSEVQSN